jgi:disulfide bond formation protein DsbB
MWKFFFYGIGLVLAIIGIFSRESDVIKALYAITALLGLGFGKVVELLEKLKK